MGNVTGTKICTHDAANKLLSMTTDTGEGNMEWTYDANGNTTSKTVNPGTPDAVTTTYVWDYEDKMPQLRDGDTLNFMTDALGFRRYKEVVGQTEIWFAYDHQGAICLGYCH